MRSLSTQVRLQLSLAAERSPRSDYRDRVMALVEAVKYRDLYFRAMHMARNAVTAEESADWDEKAQLVRPNDRKEKAEGEWWRMLQYAAETRAWMRRQAEVVS